MKEKLTGLYDNYGLGIFLVGCLLVLAIAFGAFCLEGWLLMLVWNYAIVSVFNVPTIGFWIAVCFAWLLNIIGKVFTIRVKCD